MKLSVCQLPDGLSLDHPAWADLLRRIENDRPDIAVLNEMPFGSWLASRDTFDPAMATASVRDHERAIANLHEISTAILSSRPVPGTHKLSNEAFLIADGGYQAIHHKHFFPQEPGFFEDSWFAPQRPGFDVLEHRGLRIGVLLCTELMFNEWARHYRRQRAHVIVVPRASGASRKMGHRRCHGSHCLRLLRPQLQSRIPCKRSAFELWRTRFCLFTHRRVARRNIAFHALGQYRH